MSGRWSGWRTRRTVLALFDSFEEAQDRDRVEMASEDFASQNFGRSERGLVEVQDIEAAGGGERSDFIEVDHEASLVPAGITPGLFAVRLGGGTKSAATSRA
jgi:hypothetical protein